MKDIIVLKGLPISKTSTFYQSVWVEITDNNKNEWTIHYKGGYRPKIQLINITSNGNKEILFQFSSHIHQGEQNTYFLHSINKNKIEKLKLPEQPYITGKFSNNFSAEIQFSPEDNPVTVNLKDRASNYVNEGLYSNEGKLLKSKTLNFKPISFIEPILIHEKNKYGLKSHQIVSDSITSHPIGTIETLWSYKQGTWIILNTKWIPN